MLRKRRRRRYKEEGANLKCSNASLKCSNASRKCGQAVFAFSLAMLQKIVSVLESDKAKLRFNRDSFFQKFSQVKRPNHRQSECCDTGAERSDTGAECGEMDPECSNTDPECSDTDPECSDTDAGCGDILLQACRLTRSLCLATTCSSPSRRPCRLEFYYE